MTTLASSSRLNVSYIPEATFGVTPASGTVYALRVLNESFDYSISKDMSKEINAYRSVSSMVPVSASSSGSIGGELQYAEFDRLMSSALQSAYTVYGTNGVGATFTADFTATTITASSAPTGSSAFTGLKKGQWFRVSAGMNANDGKILRVSKTTAPTATVITLDANTPAVVGAAVTGVAVQSSRLTNGTTQTSFTFQKELNDVAQFFKYTGQTPSKMDVALSQGGLSSIKFDFKGSGVDRSTSTLLPSAATPSYTYDVHSGVSGSSCVLWENGAPLSLVKSISMAYDNSLREQNALCSLSPVGLGSGNINLTLQAEIYFADGSIFDRFINNTNTELVFSSVDGYGNGYVFTIPVANISTHKLVAGGKDQDLMASVSFTALRDASNADPTLRQLVFIDRVGVAVV